MLPSRAIETVAGPNKTLGYQSLATPLLLGIGTVSYAAPFFWGFGMWWRVLPSTVVLLGVGALLYGRESARMFGLRLTRGDLLSSFLLLAVMLPIAHLLLFATIEIEPISAFRDSGPRSWFHQVLQVFNDEIVLRGALVTLLLRAFPKPRTIAFGTALVFAVSHHLVYGLGGISVGVPALITLFSTGVVLNALFLWSGHIGYGFAIHFAWNFWRFAGTRFYLDGVRLPEGETFNYLEGSPMIVAIALAGLLVAVGTSTRWGRGASQVE